MSWSYTGNPSSSALDEVRYLIGDTVKANEWTLSNEEIQYAVSLFSASPPVIGQNYRAAAESARSIMTKLMGQLEDEKVGDLSITVNKQALTFFEGTYQRLRSLATLQAVPPFLGGTSRAEKQAQDADADRVSPAFKIDGMNIKSTPPDNSGTGF